MVRVHDFGESDGLRFLTMEYVAGTTLRELLDERRRLELTPALQIAKQICRGLAAVHKAGIVHGDLKPQNVMVMGNGVVKLMDFGVARRARSASRDGCVRRHAALHEPRAGPRRRSSTSAATSTPRASSCSRCSRAASPFADRDIYEIMRMHLNEPPPNPRTLRPDLPEPLAQLILACLAKSRLQRPATAADLDRLLMRVHA